MYFIYEINGSNSNVPAVASKFVSTILSTFSLFLYLVTIFSVTLYSEPPLSFPRITYCLDTPTSPAPGWFIARPLLLWCRPTGTVPHRPRAARSGPCLLVSILLLLSGYVETNPGPAQLGNFDLGCFYVRCMRNKAAAIHDVIADHHLDFLALCETWIRFDDPRAIANDAAPDDFKISTSLDAVQLLDRQRYSGHRHRTAHKSLEEAWLSTTATI